MRRRDRSDILAMAEKGIHVTFVNVSCILYHFISDDGFEANAD